ncbi:MAG: hypothetical protein J1G06_09245 [Oscillospiraceae bacterium]|nr:hypothetical protein [Oscillospiraceae bacterium]
MALGRVVTKAIHAATNTIFGRHGPGNEPIARDKDGHELFREDIISDALGRLEKIRAQRYPYEQQWILNSNFLTGNQYCDINIYRGEIEQLEPVYDWLEREVFNNIAPIVQTRIANLKQINFAMKVNPATNELDDYGKAEISTSVLQHTQKRTGFNSIKNTAIWLNESTGNCFWLCWWDPSKGEIVGYGKDIEEHEDGSVEVKKKPYYEGDVGYGLLTPYEIYPESVTKQTIKDQRYIITEQVMTVDDIYDLYGIEVKGSTVETFSLTPTKLGGGYGYETQVMTMGHQSIDNAAKVVTCYDRPSRQYPGGRMTIIVDGEHLVYYGDLPYRDSEGRPTIPIVQMKCIEVPGQFFGKSAIEAMIPLQRAYNGVINRIHEFIKRVALGNWYVAEGSIDIEEYEQNGLAPGAMLVYNDGFSPPSPMPNGTLPPELMTERYNLKSDMEYVAGVSQLMVNGAVPSGVTSGTAMSTLRDIDNTRLSLTGDYIRNAVQELAILWLSIYKQYATVSRVIKYTGTNEIGSAIVWSNEHINSYDVEYTTENELLLSEGAQKERFFEAYNSGWFTDENGRIPERVKVRALECMKINNYGEIMSLNTLHMQKAQRENVFFKQGILPQVDELDYHEIHIDEHMRFYLQMDYQIMKHRHPEYANAFLAHIKQHEEAQIQGKQQEIMSQLPMMAAQG